MFKESQKYLNVIKNLEAPEKIHQTQCLNPVALPFGKALYKIWNSSVDISVSRAYFVLKSFVVCGGSRKKKLCVVLS